ncbi:MAG TPA: hypothetical protein DCL03_10820, partial [Leclercia adecarboxylata]|nr:hypothetical protein [Leclercia adecarboxylata]
LRARYRLLLAYPLLFHSAQFSVTTETMIKQDGNNHLIQLISIIIAISVTRRIPENGYQVAPEMEPKGMK